jgi:aspartate racemase
VLGGLGPAATAVFLDLLVRATTARTDQEHLDAVVTQHATVPDRTANILDPTQPDPGPVLARDAELLASWGADLLVLPCNTAHHYARQVEDAVAVPLVSIVQQTARIALEVAADRPVMVFATEGNVRARVYQDALERIGAEPLVPGRALQDRINTLIYDQVKAGQRVDADLFETCVDAAVEAGAGCVVMGCTELSVIVDRFELRADERIVDSLTELARATVLAAGRELTPAFC